MRPQDDRDLYCDEIAAHRAWLSNFEPWRRSRWDGRLRRAQDREGAIVEAYVRKLLADYVQRVEPEEDKSSGGVDFRCFQGDRHFYLEATCLGRDMVTTKTGLPPRLDPSAPKRGRHYDPLARAVLQRCIKKATQCCGLDAPCLLAIGTLHREGGYCCFRQAEVEEMLTGEVQLTGRVNRRTGGMEKLHSVSKARNAIFIKQVRQLPGAGILLELGGKSIAAVLCCAFGFATPTVNGILHPEAKKPFDVALLPGIRFCRLCSDQAGHIRVVWTQGGKENGDER